ncbi:MAG: hypothetical protein J0J01_11795 [Reyranella sp.]|uniref:hypothetical protein n=1 Tax=Reyranella sp. TaxID=1929291 RepID=UPI001AD1AC43|nr:hypothetical protein [Reyranella sp.]MBN9087583.1 hypothetical protein [Reyranella sp.]
MRRFLGSLLALACLAGTARAADELASAGSFSYMLTGGGQPVYAVILMPGGPGILDPQIGTGGRLAFRAGGNFLVRSRALFATGPFVSASTDATTSSDRILAIVGDLQKRFGPLKVYMVGTSRSTESTMALSMPLDGKVAGFVHSSSMNGIATFDPRKFRSRHLIVLHRMDACRVTRPSSGEASHRNYGTELIEMDGGKSTGDDCEAFAYHGYNGIERETVDKIKAWIVAK